MFEVNENTPTRLVMTLGGRYSLWSKYILDKSSGQARFARRLLIFPRAPVEVPLAEIAAADPIVYGTDDSPTHYVVVKLKSGKAYWLAGDSAAASVAAADHIRRFLGLPEPSANPVPRTARWMAKAATGIAVVALVVTVMAQAGRFIWLPDCDSSNAVQTASELVSGAVAKPLRVHDARTIASAKDELRCQGVVTADGESTTLGYRVFWQGWTPAVRLTGRVGTDRLDPARMAAIVAAAENFMARAKDSHRTGNPPRQSDPAVKPLLDAIFTTADLDGKLLAGSDINDAIRRLNIGDGVGSVYVLAGTGVDDSEKLPDDEATKKRTRDNVVRFADEFARYLDFQIRVLAAVANAAMSFMDNAAPQEWEQSDVKGKADDIRAALAQTMGSDLIAITYEGLSDRWRMDRLAALAAAAPTASRFLKPEQARALRDQALQVVGYLHNAQVQETVRSLADAVAKPAG